METVCGLYRQGCRQDKNSPCKRQRRMAAAHTHRHDIWRGVEDPPQEAPPLQPLCIGVDDFPSLRCYLHFLCLLPHWTHTEPQQLCLCIPGMLPAGLHTMAGSSPCSPLPRVPRPLPQMLCPSSLQEDSCHAQSKLMGRNMHMLDVSLHFRAPFPVSFAILYLDCRLTDGSVTSGTMTER